MEKIIIDYDLITATSINEFTKLIQLSIQKGYQPFGSVSSVMKPAPDNMISYSQAMVKYKDSFPSLHSSFEP